MPTTVKPGGIRCFEILGIENKAGFWEQTPQQSEANGSSGAESPTMRRFYNFFPKYTDF